MIPDFEKIVGRALVETAHEAIGKKQLHAGRRGQRHGADGVCFHLQRVVELRNRRVTRREIEREQASAEDGERRAQQLAREPAADGFHRGAGVRVGAVSSR